VKEAKERHDVDKENEEDNANGFPNYDHLFQIASKYRDIKAKYHSNVTTLIKEQKEAQSLIEPIELKWREQTQTQGINEAKFWLHSVPGQSKLVKEKLQVIRNIGIRMHEETCKRRQEKSHINEQLPREKNSLYSMFDKIKTIKVYFLDPARKNTKCNSYRRFGSF